MTTTLFGGEGQVGHKPRRASYPPPAFLLRRLRGLGVPEADYRGKDARFCFALADRIEEQRQAERLPPSADDPRCQEPDGWPQPERAAMGADLAAAAEDGTLTRERILSLVENTVQCLTRAELYRVAKGIAKVVQESGEAGRATG